MIFELAVKVGDGPHPRASYRDGDVVSVRRQEVGVNRVSHQQFMDVVDLRSIPDGLSDIDRKNLMGLAALCAACMDPSPSLDRVMMAKHGGVRKGDAEDFRKVVERYRLVERKIAEQGHLDFRWGFEEPKVFAIISVEGSRDEVLPLLEPGKGDRRRAHRLKGLGKAISGGTLSQFADRRVAVHLPRGEAPMRVMALPVMEDG